MSEPTVLKKILSYVYPVILETYDSPISGSLEVCLQDGKLVLDAQTANYSYGSLHTVFQSVIKEFSFHPLKKKALILGFGAGSIASILLKEQNVDLVIDGVELDHVVLEIYEKHFRLDMGAKLNLHEKDVLTFLASCEEHYDYIFIDVFENLAVPESLLSEEFIKHLQSVAHQQTQIAMNTMLKANDPFLDLWKHTFGAKAYIKEYDLSNLVLFAMPENLN